MRFKLIACKSMSRELSYLASQSQNILDITWMRQGYHDFPDVLNQTLQAEVDAVESGTDPHSNALAWHEPNPRSGTMDDFDAILIGYGLCSNGVVGLHSKSHTLVIPRGHDCITFLLGSKERYAQYFKELPGCFWYTASWIENCSMPCKEVHEKEWEYYREQGYDEDDLEFLMENMQGWTKSYHTAAYIKMPSYDKEAHQQFTQDAASYFGWDYTLLDGDISLLQNMVEGNWDPEAFLVVPPGYRVIATNDERIIDCEKMEDEP